MADEASIRMTVDSSQAVSENQKYVRAAQEGFQILLDQSEHLQENYGNRLSFLQREIELMRERNRLEVKESIATENKLYSEGKITGKERDADIANIRQEGSTEDFKIKEIKRQAQTWGSEQKDIQKEQLATQKEELRLEKQHALEDKAYQQKAERQGSDILGGLRGSVVGMTGANNAPGMLSAGVGGLTAGLGIGGILAGMLISKAIRGAATMEPVMRDYATVTNRDLYDTQGEVKNLNLGRISNLGLTPSQYYSGATQMIKSSGGQLKETPINVMAAEIATGVSRAQSLNLLGQERYGSGQITPLISFFDRYLRDTKQNISLLPEILQTFSQEATRMISATGKVDTASIAAITTVVGKTMGFTGAPLQTVVGALGQGLQQSTNPTIQALQFGAMSRAMPKGTSLWQMEMAMENPLANSKYITGMLDQLRNISGGGEQYARTLFNVFGQYGISKNFANQMSEGKFTSQDLLTQADKFSKTGAGSFEGRAVKNVGALEKATAGLVGVQEQAGFTGGTKEMVEALTKAFTGLGEAMGKVETKLQDWETEQMIKIGQANGNLEKILRFMQMRFVTGVGPGK